MQPNYQNEVECLVQGSFEQVDVLSAAGTVAALFVGNSQVTVCSTLSRNRMQDLNDHAE